MPNTNDERKKIYTINPSIYTDSNSLEALYEAANEKRIKIWNAIRYQEKIRKEISQDVLNYKYLAALAVEIMQVLDKGLREEHESMDEFVKSQNKMIAKQKVAIQNQEVIKVDDNVMQQQIQQLDDMINYEQEYINAVDEEIKFDEVLLKQLRVDRRILGEKLASATTKEEVDMRAGEAAKTDKIYFDSFVNNNRKKAKKKFAEERKEIIEEQKGIFQRINEINKMNVPVEEKQGLLKSEYEKLEKSKKRLLNHNEKEKKFEKDVALRDRQFKARQQRMLGYDGGRKLRKFLDEKDKGKLSDDALKKMVNVDEIMQGAKNRRNKVGKSRNNDVKISKSDDEIKDTMIKRITARLNAAAEKIPLEKFDTGKARDLKQKNLSLVKQYMPQSSGNDTIDSKMTTTTEQLTETLDSLDKNIKGIYSEYNGMLREINSLENNIDSLTVDDLKQKVDALEEKIGGAEGFEAKNQDVLKNCNNLWNKAKDLNEAQGKLQEKILQINSTGQAPAPAPSDPSNGTSGPSAR